MSILIRSSSSQKSIRTNRTMCVTPRERIIITHHNKCHTECNYLSPFRDTLSQTIDKKPLNISVFKNERLRLILSEVTPNRESSSVCSFLIKGTNLKNHLLFLPILGVSSHKIVPTKKRLMTPMKAKESLIIRHLYPHRGNRLEECT